jgi:hypothetical protein
MEGVGVATLVVGVDTKVVPEGTADLIPGAGVIRVGSRGLNIPARKDKRKRQGGLTFSV